MSSSKPGVKPSAPAAGSRTGGSAPSKPKSPAAAPPKSPTLPKLPKLPKPEPGWKPPKDSLPGPAPGHPPYHGSGGHLPVIGGGHGPNHDRDHDHAPPARPCIDPKGMDRLRCQKADAVAGTLLAILGLLLVPFLIYLVVTYCKRKGSARKNGHEEDGTELAPGVGDRDPGARTDGECSDGASNVGLATGPSHETDTLTKEQTQDRSSGSSPGRKPPPAYQPPARSVSRGRKLSRYRRSRRSVPSSLSPGMIRIAMLGHALQDPTVIDVPPSLAGSKKDSERRRSGGDVDGSSGGKTPGNGKRRCSEGEWHDCVDNNVEEGDMREEAERRSGSSGRRSGVHVSSEQPNEEECCRPNDAGSRRSSPRPISPGPCDQPDAEADTPDDTAWRHSVSGPASPAPCHDEEDVYVTASSEM